MIYDNGIDRRIFLFIARHDSCLLSVLFQTLGATSCVSFAVVDNKSSEPVVFCPNCRIWCLTCRPPHNGSAFRAPARPRFVAIDTRWRSSVSDRSNSKSDAEVRPWYSCACSTLHLFFALWRNLQAEMEYRAGYTSEHNNRRFFQPCTRIGKKFNWLPTTMLTSTATRYSSAKLETRVLRCPFMLSVPYILHQPSSLLHLTSFKESWTIIFGLFTRLETAFYLHGSLSMATLPRSQGSHLGLHRPDLARKASSPNNRPSEVGSLLGKPPVYSFWSRRFRSAGLL